MANTQRSQAALLGLLADNTTRNISPQDMRDVVVSIHGIYGGLAVDAGSSAQLIDTTPAKLTCFDTDLDASGTTPAHASDQITVLTDGVYQIAFTASAHGVGTNEYQVRLRVNGVESANAGCTFDCDNANHICLAFQSLITLSANDILTVYAESDNALGAQLTVVDAQFIAHRIA